ncbi:hypothetical protein B0H11DRAFT_1930644 [Mycena galericulata]|nr:hypothetical protein B0H11DRAFT_1930644 [Mycena galericulata]
MGRLKTPKNGDWRELHQNFSHFLGLLILRGFGDRRLCAVFEFTDFARFDDRGLCAELDLRDCAIGRIRAIQIGIWRTLDVAPLHAQEAEVAAQRFCGLVRVCSLPEEISFRGTQLQLQDYLQVRNVCAWLATDPGLPISHITLELRLFVGSVSRIRCLERQRNQVSTASAKARCRLHDWLAAENFVIAVLCDSTKGQVAFIDATKFSTSTDRVLQNKGRASHVKSL